MAILVFGTVMIWLAVFGAMAVIPLLIEAAGQHEEALEPLLRFRSLDAGNHGVPMGEDVAA